MSETRRWEWTAEELRREREELAAKTKEMLRRYGAHPRALADESRDYRTGYAKGLLVCLNILEERVRPAFAAGEGEQALHAAVLDLLERRRPRPPGARAGGRPPRDGGPGGRTVAELTLKRAQVWEVVEQGYVNVGRVSHGVFSTEAEAWARYDALRREQPALATPGVLGVTGRTVDVVQEVPEPKMLRGYEDKMRQEKVLK